MRADLLLLGLVAFHAADAALKLPSYIKPCSRNDPNLNACAYKHALESIPSLLPGDRKYNVPPLTPLEVKQIKVSNNNGEHGGLGITFNDIKFYGFSDAVVKETNFELAKNQVEVKVKVPAGSLIGQYEVDGKILLLAIKGSGYCNITLTDLDLVLVVHWDLVKKDDGLEYIKPVKSDIKYDMSRAYIRLDNLFGGDKALGENMNKVLNENWESVVKEIGPAVAEALSQVLTNVVAGITQLVPYADVFPETV